MKNKKPKNVDEYKEWLKDFLNIIIDNRTETYYESVVDRIKSDFEQSKVWKDICLLLTDFNNEYYSISSGYQLLINEFKPILVTKPFDSFFEKSFRRNIVLNKSWKIDEEPNPPNGGWVTPENWFEKTNDILRTFFVVKYLDGVEFLMKKVQDTFRKNQLKCNNAFEARDEGYYAVHLYTNCEFEIPKIDWDTERKEISVEIQITTQLQEVIGKLTHQSYEFRRTKLNKSDKKWQWDYESEEFKTNYLGHILHYVEGMIMEVRNKQSKKI